MRLLFTSLATPQHLYPLVPLAWAARAAGHEVVFAGTPAIAAAAVHTGLPVAVVGTDRPPNSLTGPGTTAATYGHDRFPPDWPLRPHRLTAGQRALLDQLGRNSAAAADAMTGELIAFARAWRPDVIVHDTASFAGPVAAAVLGLPNVRHLTGVGLRPMERKAGSWDPLSEYAALFDRHNVPPRLPPTLTIDPSPRSLRLPVDGLCLEQRFVPYNGAGTQPHWLLAPRKRPRVCVSWGYSVLSAALALGREAIMPCLATITGLVELDVEVVLLATARHLMLLGGLPPAVRVVESTPLHLVLADCDLIVHQAGDGTALTAAALGVPQLTVTSKPDPALTSDRLAAVGAAIHLAYRDVAADPQPRKLIADAAEKMLADSSYRAAAARLRREMDGQPAPAQVVPVLGRLLERS
ncbi:nucleotide disphospho-sugar-binding domain-containing protein [Kutzneria chonburiensis]|uniref:Nucleotide disphospho-sugar-binding domain-containing protein n=1 Tax=Kutzneria chonburiensis TaxID=1483604 RepID=A0ABV6MJX0_9PSEU|nr:nucleotide disphospho-sugar-binding domain-containing protein [Kutzneria chonburiensis]